MKVPARVAGIFIGSLANLNLRHAKRVSGVKIASGNLQGSQLLQTCLQRCCDGVAKGDRVPLGPPISSVKGY